MVCVGRDLKAHPVPVPCHGQGHLPLDQVAPSPVQPGLEHCQGWGSHSFSGQPVPGPHHPHREELLNIGYFDNLEANSRNVTNSMTLPAETNDFWKMTHLNEVQAPIVGNKSSYFFAVLDQLDSNTLPDGRVGLFSFYDDALGVRGAAEGVGLQRRAQVRLLVLLVVPLLVAAVAAELPGGAEPSALPCGTRADTDE
uniref:Uncharacterized protein n=1 Tax=Strigops habroptila TaxID=2489341 RepID=A0A672TM59_STRHB